VDLGWFLVKVLLKMVSQHNAHETLVGNVSGTVWLAMASTLGLTGLLLTAAIWRLKRYEF
jgi:hypothetical protein